MKVRRATKTKAEVEKPTRSLSKTEIARREHKRTTGARPRVRPMKSDKTQLVDNERMKQAAAMRIRGATYEQIAESLNCDRITAIKLVARALEYQAGEITELAGDYIRDALARYDAFMRSWYVHAFGGIEIDPETGVRTKVTPTEEAGRLFLRAQRDLVSMLLRARPQKLEITASAGPVNANIDSQEMARIMRGHFGNTSAWTGGTVDEPAPVH